MCPCAGSVRDNSVQRETHGSISVKHMVVSARKGHRSHRQYMLRLRGARGWTLLRIEYSSGCRDSLCAFRSHAVVTSSSSCVSTVVRDMPCQSGIFCVVKLACRVAELRLPSPAAPEQRKQRNPLSCSTRQRPDYQDNLNAMRLSSWSVYGKSWTTLAIAYRFQLLRTCLRMSNSYRVAMAN